MIARLAFALSVVLLGIEGNAAGDTLEGQVDGQTLDVHLAASARDFSANGPVWWRKQMSFLGSDYVRIHVRSSGAFDPETTLVVQGARDSEVAYPLNEVANDGLWTGIVLGGAVTVSVMGGARPDGLTLIVDQAAIQAEVGAQYSVWGGTDESKPINDSAVPAAMRELARPVAKLVFQSEGRSRTCTGFLVGANKLLTNEHCVHNTEACRSMSAIFGYVVGADDVPQVGKQYRCTHYDSSLSNAGLDATIIPLSGTPGTDYGIVQNIVTDLSKNESLAIFQYPGGKPEKVSYVNCAVMAVPVEGRVADADFTHSCDTAGGSSGSPIFDAAGELVGLHHFGFKDEGGDSTWTDNRGVRMAKLKAWILSRLGP